MTKPVCPSKGIMAGKGEEFLIFYVIFDRKGHEGVRRPENWRRTRDAEVERGFSIDHDCEAPYVGHI